MWSKTPAPSNKESRKSVVAATLTDRWKPGGACAACECIVRRHDAEEIKSSAGVVMHDTQVG
jgi:hypothetical protein